MSNRRRIGILEKAVMVLDNELTELTTLITGFLEQHSATEDITESRLTALETKPKRKKKAV